LKYLIFILDSHSWSEIESINQGFQSHILDLWISDGLIKGDWFTVKWIGIEMWEYNRIWVELDKCIIFFLTHIFKSK